MLFRKSIKPIGPVGRIALRLAVIILGLTFLLIYLLVMAKTNETQNKTQERVIVAGEDIHGQDIPYISDERFVLYFYDEKCLACQEFAPVMDEYMKQDTALPVYKIPLHNSEQRVYADFWGVQYTPTLIEIQQTNGHQREETRLEGVYRLEDVIDTFSK